MPIKLHSSVSYCIQVVLIVSLLLCMTEASGVKTSGRHEQLDRQNDGLASRFLRIEEVPVVGMTGLVHSKSTKLSNLYLKMQLRYWKLKNVTPAKVLKSLNPGRTKPSHLLSDQKFIGWVWYVTKQSKEPYRIIYTTLLTSYKYTEEDVAKLCEEGLKLKETNKLAKFVQKAQIETWHLLKMEPKQLFKSLKLKGPNLFDKPAFHQWARYNDYANRPDDTILVPLKVLVEKDPLNFDMTSGFSGWVSYMKKTPQTSKEIFNALKAVTDDKQAAEIYGKLNL